MRFSLALVAFVVSTVLAAPIDRRQGAGVGAGCDSIFSDTDTTIGESSRGAGEAVGADLTNAGARRSWKRQGAGVGAGCDSIFSDTDTTIGESSRGAGEAIGSQLSGAGAKRQLNGISDGATAVTGAVPGLKTASENLDQAGNTIDGEGTQGSANIGQEIGDSELAVGQAVDGSVGEPGAEQGGSSPPPRKRQLNGISDGATAVTGAVPGLKTASENLDQAGNTIDGEGTQGSANIGQEIGDSELAVGDAVDGSVGEPGAEQGGSSPPSGGSPPPPPPPGN